MQYASDVVMLWIALKSWYLWYSEQHLKLKENGRIVVNCSQKLISLIFGTTCGKCIECRKQLWIALKSWYLWYSEQLGTQDSEQSTVVNCSQKLISLIFGTTEAFSTIYTYQLWIALKSWYLWYSEQLTDVVQTFRFRCELLSKVDIFDIRNNK